MVKRCTKTLAGYEEKLHLIEKFQSAKQKVETIHHLTQIFEENGNKEEHQRVIMEIEQISNQILEEL